MASKPTPPRAHVALVGLSGTGKSTVAPELARRWSLGYEDLDRVVEARAGADVQDIFADRGEPTFRRLEADALAEALDGDPSSAAPVVIATGGGVVLDGSNRELLRRRAVVVWLSSDVEVLIERLAATAEARPLLADGAGTALRRLAAEREPLYREVADLVVDTTDLTAAQAAEAVAVAVEGLEAEEPDR